MATYADSGMVASGQRRPTPEEQTMVDAAAREQRQSAAREIGALTERVLLGPPGGAVGAADWAREMRARIERFRIAGSLRAPDGGAGVLVLLERMVEGKASAAEVLLREKQAATCPD